MTGAMSNQYVIFRVGAEEFGVPIAQVSSIIRWEPATPVPRAPEMVEGVINLRGRVVPVVALSRKLFGTEPEITASTRIVIAESGSGPVGLVVDAAHEVATILDEDVRPAPETALVAETAEAFRGVVQLDGRLVILLELDKALPRAEYAATGPSEAGGDETDV
jgi:purine-binding chemotaxis protein CheW